MVSNFIQIKKKACRERELHSLCRTLGWTVGHSVELFKAHILPNGFDMKEDWQLSNWAAYEKDRYSVWETSSLSEWFRYNLRFCPFFWFYFLALAWCDWHQQIRVSQIILSDCTLHTAQRRRWIVCDGWENISKEVGEVHARFIASHWEWSVSNQIFVFFLISIHMFVRDDLFHALYYDNCLIHIVPGTQPKAFELVSFFDLFYLIILFNFLASIDSRFSGE